MKKSILHSILLGFLICSTGAWAQIVNKGKAFLNHGTLYSAHAHFYNENHAVFHNDGTAYFFADVNNASGASFYNDGQAHFQQNLLNNGVFNYFFGHTGGQALAFFDGDTLQKFSGSKPLFFNKIIFNNPGFSPFQLNAIFDVDGAVQFNHGIVNNRAYGGLLIFEKLATATNVSDHSFIDGAVRKVGNAAFVYPIGADGFYRQAGTGASGISSIFTTTYYHKNPNFQYPLSQKGIDITQIDNREYWTINRNQKIQNPLPVTLSYRHVTTPPPFMQAATDSTLVIARWDVQQQKWINEGGTLNLQQQTITAAVKKVGVFTLAITSDHVHCPIVVYNLIDVSGATDNTYMRIQSSCAKILNVKVFNRWGVKVFETNHYGPSGDVFSGYSSGRLTINSGDHLPTGTYYYIITYQYNAGAKLQRKHKVGFVYIKGN